MRNREDTLRRRQAVRFAFQVAVAALLAGAVAHAPHAVALDPQRSIQEMFHRAYGQEHGLPSGATTIVQTPDGYLWVGSTSGLYRFDGARFESVAAEKLLGPSIIGLAATQSGDLWIGYDMGGGISRLRGGEIEHFPSEEGGPVASINHIRVSDDGEEVFTHGAFTVHRQHDGKWSRILVEWPIRWMELAHDGVLWAKNDEQTFYCRPDGGKCRVAPGYGGGVTGFARDRDGRVWTSDTEASGRMYRLPAIAGLPESEMLGPEYGAGMPADLGARIFLDRDGTLWSVRFGNGLARMRSVQAGSTAPARLDTFTADDGLSNNQVSRIFEDREGSIWVSTKGGLDQFRPANVVLERSIPANVNPLAYYAQAVGDAIYLHANTGSNTSRSNSAASGPLLRIAADGTIERLLEEMPASVSIARTEDDVIWLTSGPGLTRLAGGRLGEAPAPPEARPDQPHPSVVAVIARPHDTVWVWVWNQGVWEVSRGEWRAHPTMPTAEQLLRVELIRPGRDGAVWMSHYDPYKLFRHHGAGFRSFSDADVNIGAISNVTAFDLLDYLAGEHGIAIFDGDRFHTLGSDRVPALVSVRDVRATETDLWVVSRSGILRFDRQQAERALRDPEAPAPAYELFDQLDGLPAAFELSSQSSAEDVMFPRPDGRVLFLTAAGVVWLDPARIFYNQLRPPVVIKSLTANDHIYDSPRNLVLPPGSANVEIDYAALSFLEPRRVRFRYKLEGVDSDWVDPGTRRQAFYTRLDPDTYRFRVIASNDAGVWNEDGATLDFSIEPTFVQSIWFKLILAMALLSLGAAAYSWRTWAETARVRRQFEVRIAERERIARELHDTLLQSVQGLLLRVQSVANALPNDSEARNELEGTLDRADAVLREGRERVRELRLPDMDESLPERLAEVAKTQFVGRTPIFRLTLEGQPRVLQPATRDEALRIAEEAIRNAVNHANAEVVEAIITYNRSDLTLRVRDDGRGIDPDMTGTFENAGHFGLVGMRERADRIGAQLVVTTREPSGTEIELTVPASKAYPLERSGLRAGLRRRWRGGGE